MLSSQKDHFINTDGFVGLTEEQSTYAIRNIFGLLLRFVLNAMGMDVLTATTNAERVTVNTPAINTNKHKRLNLWQFLL
ncbi:hypothetical protein ALHIDCOG_00084 [Klebsiella phage CPRSB]|nr:hypothetical protein ALHIDCOG_00084 [Klebsiella phage CPRSB]